MYFLSLRMILPSSPLHAYSMPFGKLLNSGPSAVPPVAVFLIDPEWDLGVRGSSIYEQPTVWRFRHTKHRVRRHHRWKGQTTIKIE